MDNNFKSPRLYFGLAFVEIGWILDLVGIALEQSDIQYRRINPIGLQWYFLFVYLFLIILFNCTVFTDTVKTYRMLLLGTTVLSLAYIPFDIDTALHMQVDVSNSLSNVNPVKVAGLIIMAFLILAVFGSDENSYFNTFRVPIIGEMCTKPQPEHYENQEPDERQSADQRRSAFERSQQHYSSKREYTHSPEQEYTPPTSPNRQNQHEQLPRDMDLPPPPTEAVSIPINEPQLSPPVLPPQDLTVLPSPILRNSTIRPQFKASSRYAFTPEPGNPYQVSLQKGDIMDVVDSVGKW
ncbi:hypothetical protein HDV01_000433 [Terramyces sp. JEL0728]|nr:hypothetical protein HDV01_000433 [Terramyces sp. JEL0728]